jgi:hypothetical protein
MFVIANAVKQSIGMLFLDCFTAFAMTMLNTAFEITYCIFPEAIYY